MKVGYLGPKGTFSEEASFRYFEGETVEWQTYPSILDVLSGVAEGEIDYGVVPIENSIEGSVNMTVDGLTQHAELFVRAEIVLPIEHQLLVPPGVALADIREVWSHPQALAQCRAYLRSLGVQVKTFDSTAAAAAEVARSGRRDVAAIGTAWAARHFALTVLGMGLQDVQENRTRFVVVQNGVQEPEAARKTMFQVYLEEDHAGALVHILNVFAAVGINLTRIESRPTRRKLGTYHFFIDVEAGMQEERVRKVVSMMELMGHQVRILGSY
jgi:prephenate dehydratase